jgi:hypothetical protein
VEETAPAVSAAALMWGVMRRRRGDSLTINALHSAYPHHPRSSFAPPSRTPNPIPHAYRSGPQPRREAGCEEHTVGK